MTRTIIETNVSRDFIDFIDSDGISFVRHGLAHMLHEGNEVQGKYGKQGWLIVRRCIAVAMGESDKGKDPVDLFPGERVAHG